MTHFENESSSDWDVGCSGEQTGGTVYAFFFGDFALTVFGWAERSPEEEERGCRVDLQRVVTEREGSYSAVPRRTLRDPIWRGDLFTLVGAGPGNTDSSHHHRDFEGQEPKQTWEIDEAMTADPLSWLEGRLEDIALLLREIEREDLIGAIDADAVREAAPIVMAAARACMPADVLARL